MQLLVQQWFEELVLYIESNFIRNKNSDFEIHVAYLYFV